MPDAEAERLQERVDAVPYWFHSIDLGHGVVTPGHKPLDVLRAEFDSLDLPDLRGKSVLDIGGWDGGFAFEAERCGAARVAVVDHYMWSVDHALWRAPVEQQRAYWAEHATPGAPAPLHEQTAFWQPDTLPGKRGFDTARELLGSAVEDFVMDFMDCDLDELGQWDVVLYLGVLYHIVNPMTALRRVAAVTRELAVVETEATYFPGLEHEAMWRFFPGDELLGDPTNWWAPNLSALGGGLLAAGFGAVQPLVSPSDELLEHGPLPHYRAVVQATR